MKIQANTKNTFILTVVIAVLLIGFIVYDKIFSKKTIEMKGSNGQMLTGQVKEENTLLKKKASLKGMPALSSN